MSQNAVLFHKSCPDGWAAAWVANSALRDTGADVTLIAVTYGDAPPDLGDIAVAYIVDFAYPHETLVEMTDTGRRRIVVLDHHQSAITNICNAHHDFEGEADWGRGPRLVMRYSEPYETELDNNRSGAGITWDYFNPGKPRPLIIDYVEDRDLWRWLLPESKAINAYIKSQPYTVADWDRLNKLPISTLTELGRGALAQMDSYCREASSHAYMCRMGAREFPIVNVTYESCSDVANYLLETTDSDMVGYFFERGEGGWQYGFRSRNGVTVHDHAKQFGGGGHPQASGCVVKEIAHRRLGDRPVES